MYEVVKAILKKNTVVKRKAKKTWSRCVRPRSSDAGRPEEENQPRLLRIGRLKGLAEVRGVELAIQRASLAVNTHRHGCAPCRFLLPCVTLWRRILEFTMTTIVDSNRRLPARHGSILVWNHALCISLRGVSPRAPGAVYPSPAGKHDSDWGICEVNLMPGNDRVLTKTWKNSNCCTPWRKKARKARAENYRFDERSAASGNRRLRGILNAMVRPQTAIVSLTVTEKATALMRQAVSWISITHWSARSGKPDCAEVRDWLHRRSPRLRREKGLKAFTVMSCDNVLKTAMWRRSRYWDWLRRVTRAGGMDWRKRHLPVHHGWPHRPAATPETLQEIADQLGVYDRAPLPANRSVSGWLKITSLTSPGLG